MVTSGTGTRSVQQAFGRVDRTAECRVAGGWHDAPVTSYRALVATGSGPAQFQDLSDADLPEGDVTVDVAFSSLNYKDGLAVTGKGKIARSFPMVCGIDLAGTVVESASSAWAPGDEVVLTGWGCRRPIPEASPPVSGCAANGW